MTIECKLEHREPTNDWHGDIGEPLDYFAAARTRSDVIEACRETIEDLLEHQHPDAIVIALLDQPSDGPVVSFDVQVCK